MKNIKSITEFLNEGKTNIADKILNFIETQIAKDKKEYKGGVWHDFGWLVDEITQFLRKSNSSYIYRQFNDKYSYEELNDILKNNYPKEYEHAEEILNEY